MPHPGLIITADDYGLNKNCSAGIRKGVERGVITSVHVMANLVDDEDMESLINVVRAGGNRCGIGLHLNTTWGKSIIQEPAAFKKKLESTTEGNHSETYIYRGLDTYRHGKVVHDQGELAKMEQELHAQLQKLTHFLGSAGNVDAISSHHNIHLWDSKFVDIVGRISALGNIPVRSPLRWESGQQQPNPNDYPNGTKPLMRAALDNIGKAIDQVSTMSLLSTVLHSKELIRFRTKLLQGTELPVNNSGHWFGQPSVPAMKWFMEQLQFLNAETADSGYTSEIYMHLASSDFGDNPDYDYKMWQRAAELAVIDSEIFTTEFVNLKMRYPTRHGSYRSVLQGANIEH